MTDPAARMPEPLTRASVDRLAIEVHVSRARLGLAAAAACRRRIGEVLAAKDTCRMVFAAAPSQGEMLAALRASADVPWERIEAFHMDEYLDLPAGAPQRFARFLRDTLFDHVPLRATHLLGVSGLRVEDEMRRYASLLARMPIDIVCLGVGENGHIAFNDPGVAEFDDPLLVKEVRLDRGCREQQVHDGAFATLDAVPQRAMTLTVPALMSGEALFCVVPGPAKAAAVQAMLTGPVDRSCPASILRTHRHCTLYLDAESASLWRAEASAPIGN